MSKTRTTVSVDEPLLKRAKEMGLNVSAITQRALENEVSRHQYHMLNTSKSWLENRVEDGDFDSTAIYSHGIGAQFGGITTGSEMAPGDYVISYVDGEGARAVGKVLGEWREDPVTPDEKIVLQEDHDENEFHIPIYWIAIVSPANGLSSSLLEELTAGRPIYSGTHNRLSRDSDNAELIADAIIGRAYRTS